MTHAYTYIKYFRACMGLDDCQDMLTNPDIHFRSDWSELFAIGFPLNKQVQVNFCFQLNYRFMPNAIIDLHLLGIHNFQFTLIKLLI